MVGDRRIDERNEMDRSMTGLLFIRGLVLAARRGLSKLLARRPRWAMLLPCILRPTCTADLDTLASECILPAVTTVHHVGDCTRILQSYRPRLDAHGASQPAFLKEAISTSIRISAARQKRSTV